MQWDPRSAICVILSSRDYPDTCVDHDLITGLEPKITSNLESKIFHSATLMKNESFYTNGGRVLSVCSLGNNLQMARDVVYKKISDIHWNNKHFRNDIGFKELYRTQYKELK